MKKNYLLLLIAIFQILPQNAQTLRSDLNSASNLLSSPKTIQVAGNGSDVYEKSDFNPSGNYTIEVKAKVNSTSNRGIDVLATDATGSGFRTAIHPTALKNYSSFFLPSTIHSSDNSQLTTYRYVMNGTSLNIYKDNDPAPINLTPITKTTVSKSVFAEDFDYGFNSSWIKTGDITVTPVTSIVYYSDASTSVTAETGISALKVETGGTAGTYKLNIPISSSGGQYRLTFKSFPYVKAADAALFGVKNFYIKVYNGNDGTTLIGSSLINGHTGGAGNNPGWSTSTINLPIPSGCTSLVLAFERANTCILYLDNFELIKMAETGNFDLYAPAHDQVAKTGIYDDSNLLKNLIPGFESYAHLDKTTFSGATSGASTTISNWVSNKTSATASTMIEVRSIATSNLTNGKTQLENDKYAVINLNNTTAGTHYISMELPAGTIKPDKTYRLRFGYGWYNAGVTWKNIDFYFTKNPDGTGTDLLGGLKTLGLNDKQSILNSAVDYNFTSPSNVSLTDNYYLVFKRNSSGGMNITLDKMYLTESTPSPLNTLTVGKNYYHGAGDMEITSIKYTDGAYEPIPVALSVTSNSNISAITASDARNLTISGSDVKLTIDEANKTLNSLTVEAGAKVDVANPLSVSGDLVLKAGKNSAPSIKVASAITVSGNLRVEKTIDNTKWYFISFPCNVAVNEITKASGSGTMNLGTNWWIKYYDGALRGENGKGANWKNVLAGDILYANKGYIIGLNNSLTGDYVLSFPLSKNLVNAAETLKNIPVAANTGAASVNNHGWNLIGQPYLSAFKGSNTSGTFNIYLFDGSTYIPYEQSTVPDINSFTGYFVQANNDLVTNGINFALAGRQAVRSVQLVEEPARIELRLTNASGTDYALVKLDDTKTSAYEIGYDLEKWITIETDKPQLYTRIESQDLAFNVLPASEVNNLTLGYYTKNAGIQTLSSVINSNTDISELQLIDKTEGKTINLLNQNYTFDSEVGTINNRFSLQIRKVTTGTTFSSTDKGAFLYIKDKIMAINNLNTPTNVQVFDISGKLIVTTICSDTKNSITLPSKGVYTVRWFENGKIKNSKVVVL